MILIAVHLDFPFKVNAFQIQIGVDSLSLAVIGMFFEKE